MKMKREENIKDLQPPSLQRTTRRTTPRIPAITTNEMGGGKVIGYTISFSFPSTRYPASSSYFRRPSDMKDLHRQTFQQETSLAMLPLPVQRNNLLLKKESSGLIPTRNQSVWITDAAPVSHLISKIS